MIPRLIVGRRLFVPQAFVERTGLLRTLWCCVGGQTYSSGHSVGHIGHNNLKTEILKGRRRIHCLVSLNQGRFHEPHAKDDNENRDVDDKEREFKPRRENVWTIPNLLCVIRMGMAPVLGYMVISEQYGPALGLFVVAGLTDLLDGWIARVVPGQSSVMGSFLDPMADKILVGVLFISLTYMDFIPVALTGLIISRDAVLIAAGFYIRYKSLDPPRTMARYFNVTHPTAQLAPTFISKINTGIQLGLVAATLVSTVIPYDLHPYLVTLWYCTATATIVSGLSYVFAKNTYKFLKRDPTSRRFRFSRDKRRDDKDEHPPRA